MNNNERILKVKRSYERECVICGLPAELHHWKSRKAYPQLIAESFNLMPLCRTHHSECHQIGSYSFSVKYLEVRKFLEHHGWELSGEKWLHQEIPKILNVQWE